ncbi:MAG: FHA domain-containing protein [bacterium]|nr:FHA domain-containing protein [bacterium]
MVRKLFYLMVFGAIGGVLAGAVYEPLMSDDRSRMGDWGAVARVGAASGLGVGAMRGLATGLSLGTARHIQRGVLLGALVGVFGGWIGVTIGQVIFSLFKPEGSVIRMVFGRILGWSAFGGLSGLSEGVIARSPKRIRNGLLGGALGGGLGGAVFDFLAFTVGVTFGFALRAEGEAGAPSRAVALTLIGAGVGLFIGLLELATRSAWVRVIYGRNEGKDYPIDRDGAYIGRDELADVPLRGDPNVAPRHAEIRTSGGYVLVAHAPTLVNGQPATAPTPLNDGDTLQVGGFQLLFQLRTGQAARAPRDAVRSPLPPPMPTPHGVCPYCGQRQDPATGACACTPVATPAYTPTATATAVTQALALVGLDGAFAGQRIPITPAGLTVGREADNMLIVPDPSVSRRHARLALENGALVVYDLNSTNGVFVNEQRVSQRILQSGDVVRFGSVRFRVE